MSYKPETVASNGYQWLSADIVSRCTALRHAIHHQPELSHQEHGTTEKIAALLKRAGIEHLAYPENGGLVVDMVGRAKNGNGTPAVVGFRADLDALPIDERRADLDYESARPGVMHACGHDTHSAIAACIALFFHAHRDSYHGTLRIIFQPSEETEPSGARAIVDEGWTRCLTSMVGIHAWPSLAAGTFGLRAGSMMAAADTFDAVFEGRAAHGALPFEGVDAIAIAAGFVMQTHALASRMNDPNDPVVITIASIEGGRAANILCDRVALTGTIRTRCALTRQQIHERLETLSRACASASGGYSRITIGYGEPAVVNDIELTRRAQTALSRRVGIDCVVDPKIIMGSDDFGYYAEQVPSVYILYGCRNAAKGHVHALHTSSFGVDDTDMTHAADTIIDVLMDQLAEGARND